MSEFLVDMGVVSLCFAIGGLFAAADSAATSIPESRLHAVTENAPRSETIGLRRLRADVPRLRARLLVGRVICIVIISVTATRAALDVWPRLGGLVAGAAVVLAYTAFEEVVTSAVRGKGTELADLLLRLVRPLEIAAIPIAAPLARLGEAVSRIGARRSIPSDPAETARIVEAEVEYLIEEGQKTGALGNGELLQAALEFHQTVASQVMIPRTRIVALERLTPLSRVLDVVAAEGHSRYPIYDSKIDDVVAVLYVKDLFRVVREGKAEQTTIDDIARRPPLFVQENQPVSSVLKEMRQRALHMAVVLDEYGGTAGVVTLEDILEVLVGEIRDELDADEDAELATGERLVVDAAIGVDELAERLGVRLPQRNGFASLGGLVMEHLGRVPQPGTVLHVGDVDLIVREADDRRVRRIEVVRRGGEQAAAEATR